MIVLTLFRANRNIEPNTLTWEDLKFPDEAMVDDMIVQQLKHCLKERGAPNMLCLRSFIKVK